MKRFLAWAAIIVLVLGGIAYCGSGRTQTTIWSDPDHG